MHGTDGVGGWGSLHMADKITLTQESIKISLQLSEWKCYMFELRYFREKKVLIL